MSKVGLGLCTMASYLMKAFSNIASLPLFLDHLIADPEFWFETCLTEHGRRYRSYE